MPPQRIETEVLRIVAAVLGQPPAPPPWPRIPNVLPPAETPATRALQAIFRALDGSPEGMATKQVGALEVDAYFAPPLHFLLEVDELQHFTPRRALTLAYYPAEARLGFDREEYLRLCEEHGEAALGVGPPRYRRPTTDFPFPSGRAHQRALFDALKDLLPQDMGLGPTLRIPAVSYRVEVEEIARRVEEYVARWRG